MRLSNAKAAADAYGKASKLLPADKEKGKILYMMADAQLKAGDKEGAKQTLDSIADIPGFERTIDGSIQQADSTNSISNIEIESTAGVGTHPYKLNLNLGYGYDDNVFLLRDTKVAKAAGQAPDSFFYKPMMQLQYGALIMDEPLSVQGFAVYSSYVSNDAKPFNSLPIVASVEWAIPGKWAKTYDLTINDSGDFTWMNTDGMTLFSVGNTVSVKSRFLKMAESSIDVTLTGGQRNFPNSTSAAPENKSDGTFAGGSLGYHHPVSSYSFSETLSYTKTNAEGFNLRSSATSLNVLVLRELSSSANASASYTLGKTAYPESTTNRSDLKNSLELNWNNRKLFSYRKWESKVGFSIENNSSNIDSGNYTKHTVSIGVSYAAF